MSFRFSVFLLALVFPLGLLAFDREDPALKEVASSRYWDLLLHYHPTWTGGKKSEADGTGFYLSPKGKTDPLAELMATLESFSRDDLEIGNLKQHPQCAFPERYRFLKEKLALKTKDVYCKDFHEWKTRLNPQSTTLVFASSYLNNPASMFGHTFLRIDSKPRPGVSVKNDLLDYGVNYSASTAEDGGVGFALKGLTGGYRGYFSMLPYFEKVNEYGDTESRDMWEYKLTLNLEQIDRMINHLWELGTTYFDYYFLDENCGYHLLAALEVANPEWHLTDQFFYHVIPADTVRVLMQQKNSVSEIKFRPSLFRQLEQKFYSLSVEEREQFEHARNGDFELTGNESAFVLDTLIEYQKYLVMKSKKELDEPGKEKQRKMLVARARSRTPSIKLPELTADNRPDLGNNSWKTSLYGGVRGYSGNYFDYFGMVARPAFHDLLEQDTGYLPFSELTVLKLDLRYTPSRKGGVLKQLKVREFTPVDIISLNPVSTLDKDRSWTAGGGVFSPEDYLECHDCTALGFYGGAGYSAYLAHRSQNLLLYGLGRLHVQYSGWFRYGFRVGPSVRAGLLSNIVKGLKVGIENETFYFPFQNEPIDFFSKTSAKVAWTVMQNFEARIIGSYFFRRMNPFFDGSGVLSWFF